MASQAKGIVPLYGYQKRWIEDKSRFKIANKGRQTGFSFGVALEVVLDAVQSDVLVLKPQTLMDHLEELATKP